MSNGTRCCGNPIDRSGEYVWFIEINYSISMVVLAAGTKFAVINFSEKMFDNFRLPIVWLMI